MYKHYDAFLIELIKLFSSRTSRKLFATYGEIKKKSFNTSRNGQPAQKQM